ncbi:Scn11a, partial [Symbiodinium pilosum]
MMVEFELSGRELGPIFGLEGYQRDNATRNAFFVVDTIFIFIFMLEWCARVWFERWNFVKDFANLFDTVLVMSGVADLAINFSLADAGGASKSIVVLRLVRALKSLRAVRMVRSLRFFQGLRVLVKACQCFLPSLCWAMVLLLIFMSMGALMMGNLLQDFVASEDMDFEDRKWVWMRYGTAYRAMYTLFEITFAGNWPTSARPVLEKVSQFYVFFFVPYITLVVFAVIRVISAVFLKDTLDAAQNDAEQLVVDRLRKKAQYVAKLESIFMAIDETGDGIISEERLNLILQNPKVAAYLETLELDLHEGVALFHLLDNGDGEVTLDEFIDGIMRCKGPARAIDQVAMHADI